MTGKIFEPNMVIETKKARSGKERAKILSVTVDNVGGRAVNGVEIGNAARYCSCDVVLIVTQKLSVVRIVDKGSFN